MGRLFFALCAISLLFTAAAFAQAEPQENPPQESAAAPENQKKIPATIKKFTEGFQEYNEKKETEESDRPVQAAQFLADFLTDKLPLTLDFGAEPGENENTIFASLQYDWTERFSSRLKFEYNALSSVDDYLSGYTKNSKKSYAFTLLPCIWYFGDADIDSTTPLTSFGFGACYAYSKADSYACLPQIASLLFTDTDTYYHMFLPALVASVQVPFKKYFVFGAETSLLPVAYMHIDWDMKVGYGATVQSGKFAADAFSTPTVAQTVYLDILRYLRLKAVFKYSRMAISKNHYYSSTGAALSGEYVQHAFSLRYGAEFVLPSSNRTRKKSSHLWAGVYYQHEWQMTTLADNYSGESKSRWVLCFGK